MKADVIAGQVGELHMVVTIKRAATGEEFTVPLVGRVMEQPQLDEKQVAPDDDAEDGKKE